MQLYKSDRKVFISADKIITYTNKNNEIYKQEQPDGTVIEFNIEGNTDMNEKTKERHTRPDGTVIIVYTTGK